MGHFQFKVLIEGLTNAPATFQSVMNSVLHPFLRRFVVVYLDDILIYSKTAEEHKLHVRQVLDVLRQNRFYVCQSKSNFASEETKFLGHIVNSKGIRPDPKKVAAVVDWPELKNVHDVRSFLGLVNYFRKFIKDFASLAEPLTNLTRAKNPWAWTDRCRQSFLALKHCLTKAPLLRTPNEKLPYEVVTDASAVGLGAVLLQEGQPVAFESRKLNDAEKNYHTTESEMLAVVHALKTWRCYLEGATFTVVTDHVSNTFFQTQPTLSRRQARWSEFLQRFGPINWVFRAGKNNVADPLSRYPLDTLVVLSSTEPGTNLGRKVDTFCDPFSGTPATLTVAVRRRGTTPSGEQSGRAAPATSNTLDNSDLTFDIPELLGNAILRESQSLRDSVLRDANSTENRLLSVNSQGFVMRGSCIVVPDNPDLRSLILQECHDTPYSGHYGTGKTLRAVGKLFWWPSLSADVAAFVLSCTTCQRNKHRRHRPYGLMQPLELPDGPFDSISYDFITKLPLTPQGNDTICVFVDRFSKMAIFVPCTETITAKGFAKLYVDHVQAAQGLSKTFVSDRDTRFTSAFWQEVTALLGTRLCMSSAFHAQTDGQTEIANQTLEAYLRHFIAPTMTDWDEWLSRAQFAYNNSYHEGIRDTPFHLVLGRHPRTPLGVSTSDKRHSDASAFVERLQSLHDRARKTLVAARQRQKAFADKKRVEMTYAVGDQVLLSTKNLILKHAERSRKLTPRWVGPFTVVQKVGSLAYKLEMNPGWRIHPVFHVSLLEPYRSDGRTQPPPIPIELEGHLEYEVDCILDHRFSDRKRENLWYLILWKGYGPEHNSWEPEGNVANAPEVVGEYWQRIGRAAGIGAAPAAPIPGDL